MVLAIRKKKKRRCQIHNLVLAAIEQVWMVPVIRKKKKQEHLMGPSSPNYEMFCYQGWETEHLPTHILVGLLDQP